MTELLPILDARYKRHGGAPIINGLGDSIIGGSSIYSIYNSSTYQSQIANNIPAYSSIASGTVLALGSLCVNASYVYRVSTAGTSASVAPTGTATTTDGTAVWTYVSAVTVSKLGNSMLTWAEIFAGGRVAWDLSLGYGGIANTILKILVINGGTNYTAPVITLSNGATATATVVGGVITAVNVTNPGYNSSFTLALSDATGTGAVLSLVQAGSGTFGVPGCSIQDVRVRLPDVIANPPNIMVVHIGTNNSVLPQSEAQLNAAIATDTADLKYIYETLMTANIKVVAVPITPRAFNVTRISRTYIQRLNKWIRAYVASKSFANPSQNDSIALADASGYFLDGTNGTYYPIGGLGGVVGAVTVDGLHSAHRGGMYNGYVIAKAIQRWVGDAQAYAPRSYSADDGYDTVLNPGGNMLEGPDWVSGMVVTVGRQCNSSGNIYKCSQAGTTATTPTGTGVNIGDGTARWDYMGVAKTSVFGAGSTAISTATNIPAGTTISGNLANGYTIARSNGSGTACAGTVTLSLESPWSNGQIGQRQVITFSLGSGPATERWDYLLAYGVYGAYTNRNIQPSDLGVTLYEAEIEVELSNVVNMNRCNLTFSDTATGGAIISTGPSISAVGQEMINSAGDPLVVPNGGKLVLKTAPFILPPNMANLAFGLSMGFNASGGAASAGATVKINHVSLNKYSQI